MIKTFKILLISMLTLIVLSVGFLKYREYSANKTLVPSNVHLLVKLNTDQLIKSVLLNVPLNLGYYFKSSEKRSGVKKVKLFDAIKMPASLFVYILKTHKPNTFFARFSIDDYEVFERLIGQKKNLKSTTIDGTQFAFSGDKKLSICYNKNVVAVCYSLEAEDVTKTLVSLLNDKALIPVKQSGFTQVLESKRHVAFGDKHALGFLDFESGKMLSEFSFTTDKIIPSEKPKHRNFKENDIALFWMNASIKNIPNQVLTFKNYKIETDSLLKYYKDYLDLEWTAVTTQKDSVITYEYNDDFEKEEKVSVKERKIPSFNLGINADGKALQAYLARQDLLDTTSGNVNSKAFPLYQLKVFADAQNFIVGTKLTSKTSVETSSIDFMQLQLNLKRMKAEYPITFISSYLKGLDSLRITGKVASGNVVTINGKADLSNGRINSFYQLLKMF